MRRGNLLRLKYWQYFWLYGLWPRVILYPDKPFSGPNVLPLWQRNILHMFLFKRALCLRWMPQARHTELVEFERNNSTQLIPSSLHYASLTAKATYAWTGISLYVPAVSNAHGNITGNKSSADIKEAITRGKAIFGGICVELMEHAVPVLVLVYNTPLFIK